VKKKKMTVFDVRLTRNNLRVAVIIFASDIDNPGIDLVRGANPGEKARDRFGRKEVNTITAIIEAKIAAMEIDECPPAYRDLLYEITHNDEKRPR
jgi:hypothetical protein